MTDENLLESLKQAATPPAPQNFRPGVVFDGQRPSEITTPPLPAMERAEEWEQAVRDLGYPLPEGYGLVLVEMLLVQHESFWKRDPVAREGGGQEGMGEAYTAPSNSFRYRFKVVERRDAMDADLAAMMEAATKAPPPMIRPRTGDRTKIINLADFQVGKRDELGGAAEMLARSEAALHEVLMSTEWGIIDEIVLIDVGDSTEGFESAPNAAQTNDLDQTEQIRVWRRILWRWIAALADRGIPMKVIGVPSNHCRVRKGRNAQGGTLDDWGIEVIAQVSDIAAANEQAYGHVEFIVPNSHEEHVLVTLAGGQVLGVAHGHQKSSPGALAGWVKSTGRRGLAQADIVVVGHFHHLVVEAFGDQQWLFICPTNDNGSSWFTPSSGERSEPGVLTLEVDDRRWDMNVIWLGDIE